MESNYIQTNLRFYSIGIVVYDKLKDTDIISVIPIETLNTVEGSIRQKIFEGIYKGVKVFRHYIILAKWFPNGNDNRITPPDVYENETVEIYRYADEDKYFWTTMFYEKNLRRLEHVRYSYSNQPKGTFDPIDDNSSYYVEYSTRDKYIYLHTSTNDGEAAGYDIKINTATGVISITDTYNNQLIWQSPQKTLNILNFNEINITCPQVNINGHLYVSEGITAPSTI